MLGVKIILMLFVVTFVWHVLTNVMLRNSSSKVKQEIANNPTYAPWWYLLDGFLILIDLFGLVYIAAYFIFIFFK